jgi:transcriptional regulator with XRE-family HTH domain
MEKASIPAVTPHPKTLNGSAALRKSSAKDEAAPKDEMLAKDATSDPLVPPTISVDPDTAERFISEKKIGERIKRLRLRKSMGLVELGRHTGLSASFLSQLETGRVVPTLRNLARIAMVFSKDLAYFFEPEPTSIFRIHRKTDRVRLPQTGVDDPTYFFESLGYMVPDRSIDPYLAEFVPLKKGVEVRPHVHMGQEFLYVMEGSLDIRHGETNHTLEAGDCVYFDATTQHSYRCAGTQKAVVLIVTMQHTPQSAANRATAGARIGNTTAALTPGTSMKPVQMSAPTELPPLRRPMRQM